MAENEKVKRVCLDDLIQDFLLWEKVRDKIPEFNLQGKKENSVNSVQIEIKAFTASQSGIL